MVRSEKDIKLDGLGVLFNVGSRLWGGKHGKDEGIGFAWPLNPPVLSGTLTCYVCHGANTVDHRQSKIDVGSNLAILLLAT